MMVMMVMLKRLRRGVRHIAMVNLALAEQHT